MRRVLGAALALASTTSVVACSGLLGFDDLTNDGTPIGDAATSDGASSSDGAPIGDAAIDAPLDPLARTPTNVKAAPPGCMVTTLVPATPACNGDTLCGVSGFSFADDSNLWASLEPGSPPFVRLTFSSGSVGKVAIHPGATLAPVSIFLVGSTLYEAEAHRLGQVETSMGIYSTIVNSPPDGGAGLLDGVVQIAVTSTGSAIWIADKNSLRWIDASKTVHATTIPNPQGVAVGPGGSPIYYSSAGSIVATSSAATSSIAVYGAEGNAGLLAMDGAYVAFVADGTSVRIVNPAVPSPVKPVAGHAGGTLEKDGDCLTIASFETITAIAVDSKRDILVGTGSTGSLRKIVRNAGSLDVSWEPSAGTSSSDPVTGYEATATVGAVVRGSCTTVGTACTITGLPSDVPVVVTVTATTALGVSPPSVPISQTAD